VDVESKVRDYLRYFADKDISKLRDCLAENCVLNDWEQGVIGRENILGALSSFYESAKDIGIYILTVYVEDFVGIAQFRLEIDDRDPLEVVDIIIFDDDGKIVSIEAYKQ